MYGLRSGMWKKLFKATGLMTFSQALTMTSMRFWSNTAQRPRFWIGLSRKIYDLCRIGDTAQFIDLGSAKSPHDGAVIDFTFDEFFPRWLEAVADVAKAHLARMASTAIDALHDDP
jgi:hypothetical protein